MPAAYTGSRVGAYKYAQRVKRVKSPLGPNMGPLGPIRSTIGQNRSPLGPITCPL